ncbi:alpha/beta hydrolase [Chitinimonas sp. BJYL2]|uniref:alpha/beta hydrolase n=1 Tax=Chitinimonas sp. BJYL2 TaxID=2976696 RepID=UPI0022B45E1F|nr:alpha/beta hydrolase [Chitinimonas sp. BJYL2]
MQIDTFTASDGVRITRYHWPVAAPRRLVVIAHGMAEHAARYDALARHLNTHGCSVWALDHRGHGGSAHGRPGHFADASGWDAVVGDLIRLLENVRASHPGVPLALLGHSMGAFVARSLVLQRPGLMDGLILSAPGFRQARLARWMGRIAAWDAGRRGADQPSSFLRKLVFGTFNLRFLPARTPFDWLSRDPATVDAYIADPQCGFDCTPRLWQDLFEAIVAMEAREGSLATLLPARLSVWLMAGSHDPVSMGGKGCKQLAQHYVARGVRDVYTTIYPGGRHEMFNETNRDEVWQALVQWLDRRFDGKAEAAP